MKPIEIMARAMHDGPLLGEGYDDLLESEREWINSMAETAVQAFEEAGFRIVPIEPTEEMTVSGYHATQEDKTIRTFGHADDIYKAMLEAAPK